MMLETITSNHRDLRQITIHIPYNSDYNSDPNLIKEVEAAKPGTRWSDLDRLLVQLLEFHSIVSKIVCLRTEDGTMRVGDRTNHLLPRAVERGAVEIVERSNLYAD